MRPQGHAWCHRYVPRPPPTWCCHVFVAPPSPPVSPKPGLSKPPGQSRAGRLSTRTTHYSPTAPCRVHCRRGKSVEAPRMVPRVGPPPTPRFVSRPPANRLAAGRQSAPHPTPSHLARGGPRLLPALTALPRTRWCRLHAPQRVRVWVARMGQEAKRVTFGPRQAPQAAPPQARPTGRRRSTHLSS